MIVLNRYNNFSGVVKDLTTFWITQHFEEQPLVHVLLRPIHTSESPLAPDQSVRVYWR
jgi:hypothetical protein